MACACSIWGLMAPLAKHAMTHGIPGLEMVTFRIVGGAACFWIASLFLPKNHVQPRHLLMLFFASLLSIVINQCSYTIGLSLTSPVNASIMTTTMPIITLILAAIVLREPITGKKVTGVIMGCTGAFVLIMASQSLKSGFGTDHLGTTLCFVAQCSFALYLTLFKHLIQRYSIVTCMKWMLTFAALVVTPFSATRMVELPWRSIGPRIWAETAFIVVFSTFVAYLLMMRGQKTLRPTVVAMYNYVQPIVATLVSVALGLATFGWWQAAAVVLVFGGVWLVTQSKSRKDLKREKNG